MNIWSGGTKVKGTLSAKVLRADGTVDDLGNLAKHQRTNLIIGVITWMVIILAVIGGIKWYYA
jgi:hypothetical protein